MSQVGRYHQNEFVVRITSYFQHEVIGQLFDSVYSSMHLLQKKWDGKIMSFTALERKSLPILHFSLSTFSTIILQNKC